jgi:hypothetical protein
VPEFIFVAHDHGITHGEIRQTFPDLATARRDAVRALTEVANEELPGDGDRDALWIRVSDETGQELFVASLNFEIAPGRK